PQAPRIYQRSAPDKISQAHSQATRIALAVLDPTPTGWMPNTVPLKNRLRGSHRPRRLIFCSRQKASWIVPSPRPPKDGISNSVRSLYDTIRRNLIPLSAREDFKGMVFKSPPFRGFKPHTVVIVAARLASGILERTKPF